MTNPSTLKSAEGSASLLPVNTAQTALLSFKLSDLNVVPNSFQPTNIKNATLLFYVVTVTKPGELYLATSGSFPETFTQKALTGPHLSSTAIATIPVTSVQKKGFVSIDVTQAVQAALTSGSDLNLAISTGTAKVMLGSKEGVASGYAAQLVIDADFGGTTASGINFQIGTVTSGSAPGVTLTGSGVLNFVLQQGPQGDQGIQGPPGPQGPQGLPGLVENGGTASALVANPWDSNLNGQAFVFEGDSITQSPNGAGVESYAAILASGTTALSFFNGHGTYYNDAVGGSVIGNGPTPALGTPQTVSASWTGTTTTITLASSPTPPAGIMAVTGPNIPAGTTGSINGNVLTISQPTTGASGGSVTINLGGNNVIDRYASQVHPHRPAAFGGDGGPRAFLFLMIGANALDVGESATQIISEITAEVNMANADGFAVVLSTILPDIGQDHWNYSQEEQRQIVNQAIRRYQIPGTLVIDSCEALSGDPNLFDGNGVHPLAQANVMLARYWNSALIAGCGITRSTKEYVDTDTVFNAPVTFNRGFTHPGMTGQALLDILQPNLSTGQTSVVNFGVSEGQQDWGVLGFYYDGATADPANSVSLGVGNGMPLYMNGAGEESLGESSPLSTTVNIARFTSNAVNAEMGLLITHSAVQNNILSAAFAPLTPGTNLYAWFVGVDEGTNNSAGLGWYHAGSNSLGNSMGVYFLNGGNPQNWFASGDVVIGGTTDNGFKAEINGAARVDSNLTVTGTLVLGGTTAPPTNTTTPVGWQTILSGTSIYKVPVYQ